MATPRICSIPDCDKPAKGRGWCNAHWTRWRKHGDPLGGRTPRHEPEEFLHKTVLAFTGDDCLVWPYATDGHGYGQISRGGRPKKVHRVVCELVYGEPPFADAQAAHSCGNGDKGCVSPRHLRWATPSENQMDRVEHGTSTRGARHGMSKLTEEAVRQVRLLCETLTQKEVAAQMRVSRATICMIMKGKRWQWLADQ